MKRPGRLQAGLMRVLAGILSPGGRRGSLVVLMYHRVLPEPDLLLADEPDAATFAAQMDLIGGLCNVLVLAEAVKRLESGSLPPRALAITFDDGYANNVEVAAPILTARGLTATFFVATGFIEGGRMWNDTVIEALRGAPEEFDLRHLELGRYSLPDIAARRRAVDEILACLKYLDIPERLRRAEAIAEQVGLARDSQLMMSQSQLRCLAGLGMEIGAHSVRHPILSRVSDDTARQEIIDSKRQLEEILRAPVRTFAYPNGRPGTDYDRRHVAMVRDAGFEAAVSTAWGAAAHGSDPYQIPRVAPWDRTALRYGLRMLRGFSQRNPATA